MGTWTDMLAEFLHVRGFSSAVFGGAAMGGALAIQMALDHPDLVRAIVVSATEGGPGSPPATGPQTGFVPTLAATRTSLRLSFFDQSLVTDAFVRMRYEYLLGSNIGYTLVRHLADHPPITAEQLARVKVPALVIWCREDSRVPPELGEALVRPMMNAKLVLFDHCGHLPNMERPAAFNAAIVEFLHSALK